ncbi:hypothetical protein ACU4GA_18200 [Methylobacterium oryzae CBMB20]
MSPETRPTRATAEVGLAGHIRHRVADSVEILADGALRGGALLPFMDLGGDVGGELHDLARAAHPRR